MIKTPKKSDTLDTLVAWYLRSDKYLRLKGKTQYDYAAQLDKVCTTLLDDGKMLGAKRLSKLSVRHVQEAYTMWLQSGITTANARAANLSVVYRVAMQYEIVSLSPVSLLDRVKPDRRVVRWTRQHVEQFLAVCATDFNYRSIGIIAHMAYEFAQRLGDMRLLQWSSVDLVNKRIDLVQSKKGVAVHLPISPNLLKVLQEQHKSFGHLKYVAPRVKARTGEYSPYDLSEISKLFNEIKDVANLPPTLWGMDLRRTAITEMVVSGSDVGQIMQVSGHQNPQSVKPYMTNTFEGATNVLDRRNKYKEREDD
jgi:integrase